MSAILRRALVLSASLVALFGLVSVPAAQAAVSCSGTVTARKYIGYAELVIYYNFSNGGTNSACLNHLGESYGVSRPTSVQIFRCAERSGQGQACTVTASSPRDSDSYSCYAGPVVVTGTANYCVAASGSILWNGDTQYINTGRQGCPN